MVRILPLLAALSAFPRITLASGVPYTPSGPQSSVVALTAETFDQATQNDPANPLWFLKFFQTWCGHCKRMVPVLEKVAPEITGKMAIGTIDCGREKTLCKKFGVRSYPTLKFSMDGETFDYPSGRDADSILQFANKMSAPSVVAVSSFQEAMKLAESYDDTEGVAFVGYDASATGESLEDVLSGSSLGRIFAQAARKQQAYAHFLWLLPGSDVASFLPSENGMFVNRIEPKVAPRAWNRVSEGSMPGTIDFIDYIGVENVPMVAMLGPANFQKIGKNGRPLVIGVVDVSEKDQVDAMKTDLSKFITESSTPQAVKDKYYYGVMDGVKWFRFLDQFNISKEEIPQVFILDVPTKEYWQNTTYASNAEQFVQAVEAGLVESSSPIANMSTFQKVLMKFEKFFLNNFPYSLIAMLVGVFGIVYLLVPSSDDLRPMPPGYFDNTNDLQLHEEETEPTEETNESKKDK